MLKLFLMISVLFLSVIFVRFMYTGYYTQSIQPDFTLGLSIDQLNSIKNKQNSFEFIAVYTINIFIYYLLIFRYIYNHSRNIKFVYLLPLSMLVFDIYIYIYENEPMLDMYLFVLVEFLPIFISVFILYAFHKKL